MYCTGAGFESTHNRVPELVRHFLPLVCNVLGGCCVYRVMSVLPTPGRTLLRIVTLAVATMVAAGLLLAGLLSG